MRQRRLRSLPDNRPTGSADNCTREGMDQLTLDVAAPDQVAPVLRRAADKFSESAAELEAAWQDKNAGKPWHKIARILEQTADKIDKALA